MGAGKTATLSFLAMHYKALEYNIFANYNLKTINFKHVLSSADIDNVKFGKAFYDEFWLWLDSRCSSFDESNKAISDILLKSRKRGYDIYYTLQGFYQIDKRVRNVTDYVLVPQSYVCRNGQLESVEQNFLFPFDMKPLINEIVIDVDICVPVGEYELEKIDNFSFWLKDVINTYDTTEEISDIKNPLQKGMYIEGGFMSWLKTQIPEGVITQSPNSGHYLNSLDIEVICGENLFLIDVTSVESKKVKEYEYFYINRRDKPIQKTIEIGVSRKAQIFTAYKFLNQWLFVNMNDKTFIKLCEHKDMINIRDIKDISINIEEFKKVCYGKE